MATALDLITSAMRKIGALTINETPTDDEASAGLEMLNDLIDSWSNESLLVNSRTLETYTMTGGDGEYTIGSGGDINTTRPTVIVAAYVTIGTTDYDLAIVDDESFAQITQKTTQSSHPEYLNYNNAHPLGTIKLWPLPAAADTLNLLSEKPISTFAATSTTVTVAPGWKRALIYNLAQEMASEYGMPITRDVNMIAKQSKSAIRRTIAKNRTMDVPTDLGDYKTIYTGYNTT